MELGKSDAHRGNLFISFVDAMFTTLMGPVFTKLFDRIVAKTAISCVWRACIAD